MMKHFPKLRYGVAYYDEYMPCERLEKDVEMMQAAGVNTVRIAESTWSTLEPRSGVFDFTSIDRVLSAMEKAGIDVIVGTPTYAIPTWLAAQYPDVLAVTQEGRGLYGHRQNMDITHPAYRYYGERVIRKLLEHVKDAPCVIGYQVDNETKHYGTAGENVQRQFVEHLKRRFNGSLEAMNKAFGLDYWSNRIDAWEDFPDVRGSINPSLTGAFARFQRQLVTEYLQWQADIVNEYRREDQFITHNFDYDWRGYSFGVQPDVDHFAASAPLDFASVDIYHPSQDHLTGAEIAFGGDMSRSLKGDNYLVMETQAQGFPQWLPYPGQLRLQAFSHLASGANGVMYWHWDSLHNGCETYWKGLLSQDFAPNPTYREACTIGADFARLSEKLIDLKVENRVAILVSNEALTGAAAFPMGDGVAYNDVVRGVYDALYRQNIGCDFIGPESGRLADYDLVIAPALYCVDDGLLQRLKSYVEGGGHLLATFKFGFSDEETKVRAALQPAGLSELFGASYSQFTLPDGVTLQGELLGISGAKAAGWMELLTPCGAQVLAGYAHPFWGSFAALTRNACGRGAAWYLGCYLPEGEAMEAVVLAAAKDAGITPPPLHFPLITRGGRNQAGKAVRYLFNYSGLRRSLHWFGGPATELVGGKPVAPEEEISLPPWGLAILEEA